MIDPTAIALEQAELFDVPPQKAPLVCLPAAREISEAIKSLPVTGIMMIQGPPRTGLTSAIQSAIERGNFGKSDIYSTLNPEDTPAAAIASLCAHFRAAPGAKLGQKTIREMIDALVDVLARNNIKVMVFEHMEQQEPAFDRAIIDIANTARKRGLRIRFVVHFCVFRKKARDLDKALSSRILCQYWMDPPRTNAVLSVFCLNLGAQAGEVSEAISAKPRPAYVTRYVNQVLGYIEGDMCRAVTLANRLSYYFGNRPVDADYFSIAADFISEKDPLRLYPKIEMAPPY
jgi:hypothetical protein